MPIEFLLLGGGGGLGFFRKGGGWKCQFSFYGRAWRFFPKSRKNHVPFVSRKGHS